MKGCNSFDGLLTDIFLLYQYNYNNYRSFPGLQALQFRNFQKVTYKSTCQWKKAAWRISYRKQRRVLTKNSKTVSHLNTLSRSKEIDLENNIIMTSKTYTTRYQNQGNQ